MLEEGFHNILLVLPQCHVIIHFGFPGRKVEAALTTDRFWPLGRRQGKPAVVSKRVPCVKNIVKTNTSKQKLYQNISFEHF